MKSYRCWDIGTRPNTGVYYWPRRDANISNKTEICLHSWSLSSLSVTTHQLQRECNLPEAVHLLYHKFDVCFVGSSSYIWLELMRTVPVRHHHFQWCFVQVIAIIFIVDGFSSPWTIQFSKRMFRLTLQFSTWIFIVPMTCSGSVKPMKARLVEPNDIPYVKFLIDFPYLLYILYYRMFIGMAKPESFASLPLKKSCISEPPCGEGTAAVLLVTVFQVFEPATVKEPQYISKSRCSVTLRGISKWRL